jgi:hypothetical protein
VNNNEQTSTTDAGVEETKEVRPDQIEAMPYGAPPARRRIV